MSGFGRVCAVVVTYNTGESYLENFHAVIDQVQKVFIVDNGSDEKTRAVLKNLESEYKDKVEVIYYSRNFGLAYAQNGGIKRAGNQMFDWVLLLDHDSAPEPQMVAKMAEAYLKHPDKDKIAIIGPYLKDVNSNQEPKYVLPRGKFWFSVQKFKDKEYLDVLMVIASGSLIKTKVFQQAGVFIEDYFIDYIDTEFCLRLISKGWKIIAVKDAMLNHALGKKEVHKFMGFKVITSNHIAERRYYIYKNRCQVWKKYLLKVPSYVIYDILAAQFDICRILMFEKDKISKLVHIFNGCTEPFKYKVKKYGK